MKTHQIKAWLRLVDAGSIRAAARSLNLTQAAVTKAIRELEEDLDASLVVRSSTGITVTEVGHRLTDRLRLAWNQIELARQDIQSMRGGRAARVGVAVTPTMLWTMLPAVVREFRRQMPLASLNIEEGLMNQILVPLRHGTIDFCVGAAAPNSLPNDLNLTPIRQLEMMVACRPGHPHQTTKAWSPLQHCDWLVHPSHEDASATTDFLRTKGIDVERRLIRTNTFAATWTLLTQTDALFLCPAMMLQVPLYGEMIRRVNVKLAIPRLSLGIIRLKDAPLSHAAKVLALMFEREIRNLNLVKSAG